MDAHEPWLPPLADCPLLPDTVEEPEVELDVESLVLVEAEVAVVPLAFECAAATANPPNVTAAVRVTDATAARTRRLREADVA